jgi:hypothetical protein
VSLPQPTEGSEGSDGFNEFAVHLKEQGRLVDKDVTRINPQSFNGIGTNFASLENIQKIVPQPHKQEKLAEKGQPKPSSQNDAACSHMCTMGHGESATHAAATTYVA